MTNSSEMRCTRRNFLSYSALAVGGLSLSSFIPMAEAASSLTVREIITPTTDNPIRLNFNENALGISPYAKQAAVDAIPKANRYAKAEMLQLSKAVADHHDVSPDHILLTAGSSEGIRASLAGFRQENTQFIIPELTYGDGEFFANINRFKVVKVASLKDWSFNIPAISQAINSYRGRSIVYLVNPNNPTSTITPAPLITNLITSNPNTTFIIDEAYAEFVDDPAFSSVDTLIKQGVSNVILLKTFSKIHAMAGLRVGYILATPTNIRLLSNYVAGEKLNYCGVVAAIASLKDSEHQTYSKQSNRQSREIMVQTLTELNHQYLSSQTNFVFYKIDGDLESYQNRLKENHILVGRAFPPATNWCRVTLGTPDEMRYVAKVLKALNSGSLS